MVDKSVVNVEAELVATIAESERRPADDVPFRVLLIGDWSGRANRRALASTDELKTRTPLLLDRDNLDQLMARLGVRLNLRLGPETSQLLTVTFNQLEDFHPDSLFRRLEIFELLRRTRSDLESPATFPTAAATVRKWEESAPREAHLAEFRTATKGEPAANDPSGGKVLDRILAGPDASSTRDPSQPTEASVDISRLARAAAEPYLTPDIESDQEELIHAVDARAATIMRNILHQKDFQALEAAWRGLDFLVSRLETGTDLKLYLLDISFEEFKADLRAHDDFRATALYHLLVEDPAKTFEGIPWSVVGGNYTFDFCGGDAGVVETMAAIGRIAGAPFVGGVTSELLGCESLPATPDPDDWRLATERTAEEAWKRLTNLSDTAYVGFALPRFLLRLPYGKATEPVEEFDFEEIAGTADPTLQHESYLWANPAFAVVFLLAKGFSADGPAFRPADHLEIDGLPLHVYERDGNTEIKPGAEVLLTLRAAAKIIERRFMPLLSIKDSDRIRLGMFQSIDGGPLRGRWSTDHRDR